MNYYNIKASHIITFFVLGKDGKYSRQICVGKFDEISEMTATKLGYQSMDKARIMLYSSENEIMPELRKGDYFSVDIDRDAELSLENEDISCLKKDCKLYRINRIAKRQFVKHLEIIGR